MVVLANWGIGEAMTRTLAASSGVELVAVLTDRLEPDAGIPWSGAVAATARELSLPLHGADLLDFDGMAALLQSLRADYLFMHGCKRILPRRVFAAPARGTINLHPSLLPRYRGPAPHHWVLRNQDRVAGLSTHFVDEGIDTGPLVAQREVLLRPGEETMDSLLDKLRAATPELVCETLENLARPGFSPRPQNHEHASYAPSLENHV